MPVTPERAVEVANEAFGPHPGYRALHARGTLLRGSFTATPEAASLTTAAHMQGEPVPATVRVSNGSGNPNSPDYTPDVRGLAVKFYLPDGSRTDIVAQTAARFPVHSPEAFVELLGLQSAGVAAAWKLPLFLARHPEAITRLPTGLPALRPPRSYASRRYYAIHAYRFIDGDGGEHYVRYTFVPEHEEPPLGVREARARGREYLQDEIRERVAQGPIRFTLQLQIAGDADNPDDPASDWPSDRQRVRAGTLEIDKLETEREKGDDVLVFDPGRVTDGIEPSEDPVLRFRPEAYSASVARRMAS